MLELALWVTTLALLDGLASPATLGAAIYLLGRPQPVRHGLAFIGAGFGVYVVVGLLAEAGLSLATRSSLFDPRFTQSVAEISVGGLLVLVGYRSLAASGADGGGASRSPSVNLLAAAVLGLGATVADLSTAAPYLAAIERINRANLPAGGALLAILGYDLVYIVPLLVLFAPTAGVRRWTARYLRGTVSLAGRTIRWVALLMVVFGGALIVDGLASLVGPKAGP